MPVAGSYPGSGLVVDCINFCLCPLSYFYRLFIRLRAYFQGTVIVGCSQFLNLPLGICLAGWSLLYDFQAYLLGTVGRECSLILLVLNLHPGNCLHGMQSVLQFSNLPQGECQARSTDIC